MNNKEEINNKPNEQMDQDIENLEPEIEIKDEKANEFLEKVDGAVGEFEDIQQNLDNGAINFGELTTPRYGVTSCSSSTRGIFGGGYDTAVTDTIEFITIATESNAANFGDLTVARLSSAACSSETRGVFAGGGDTGVALFDTIDFITIATENTDAADFGNLTTNTDVVAGCSNSHGGL